MGAFFDFLGRYWGGITVLLVTLLVFAALIHWMTWVFAAGRFRTTRPRAAVSLPYVIAQFFVNIINDFRHLLAVAVVFVFAFTILIAMWAGFRAEAMDGLIEGLQAAGATLGGLVGSIIGYYFGESAAVRGEAREAGREATRRASVQSAPSGEISRAPTPAPAPPTEVTEDLDVDPGPAAPGDLPKEPSDEG